MWKCLYMGRTNSLISIWIRYRRTCRSRIRTVYRISIRSRKYFSMSIITSKILYKYNMTLISSTILLMNIYNQKENFKKYILFSLIIIFVTLIYEKITYEKHKNKIFYKLPIILIYIVLILLYII